MKILSRAKNRRPLKTILFVLFNLALCVGVFAAPGRLDFKFPQILASGAGGANVTAIETQPDGKIIVAGEFVTRGANPRNDMLRLNADGTLDATFSIGTGTSQPSLIRFIKMQPDGKILIAGYITQLNGTFTRSIIRLNPDGGIDTTFTLSGIDVTFVYDLDIQTDGKILISAMNLIGSSFIARLNADGSNDGRVGQWLFGGGNSFTVAFSPADNKILVGGRFSYTVNQTPYQNLARLNLDGSIDTTFKSSVTNSVFDLSVNAEPLAGGKILVWGKFDAVNGTTRRNLAVLDAGGILDAAFNPALLGAETILSVQAQTNGKIVIGGTNFALNSPVRGSVARLNADGSVDRTFNCGRGANGNVNALKIRNGNKLLIGGSFFRYHVFPRTGLAQTDL